jgi:hypothetical protein
VVLLDTGEPSGRRGRAIVPRGARPWLGASPVRVLGPAPMQLAVGRVSVRRTRHPR